ncbi:M28 family peptidase [Flagellimonas okinawensis]|uniref:M28 family peptidase n=1 Tax=Flagellimonas okinawensis TaxID=3031324 RepID=A0ABT5XMN9_9FLAO|nr:M28 family peptidase [[Muricauda] okinawensis]MDF0707155.1 M28 family peptidase [[Muricauda] okinawensis]
MKKSLALCFAFSMSVVFFYAQSDKEKASGTVDKNTIESHIRFLSDDLLEGREAGTKGNKIAASYLASQLQKYGAKPVSENGSYYQKFQLQQSKPPSYVELSLKNMEYPLTANFKMPAIDHSGNAVFLGYGSEEDFKDADVSGKTVVVLAGSSEDPSPNGMFRNRSKKMQLAQENGAQGLIELVDFDESFWTRVKHFVSAGTKIREESNATDESTFFHTWVNTHKYNPDFKKGEVMLFSVKSDGQSKKYLDTQNVVGVLEGSDPELKNEYVIYSAHYDHVGIGQPNAEGDSIYNGARDNNIGVTAVLSMLENLSQYPTKRSALFIWFTAEEKGLLGSKYYADNPLIPLHEVSYCFNTDGGGYNDTSLATIIGLERTSAEALIVEGAGAFGLKAIGDPAPEQGLFDRSDNVSFAKKGIPAPTYSTGFDSFDEEIMKYYHQADDEADSLDYDYLLKFYQGYVYSGRLIANTPDKLFWNAGDKYEEAGKALYGMK